MIDREPKFEEKWQELRKKALDMTASRAESDSEKQRDDKRSKKNKKEKKRDTRKDKKKRSKKRKRDGSGSSSSGTDDSDTDNSSDKSPRKSESDSKSSIRVQMRNLQDRSDSKSKNDELTGKWTMVNNKPVPPPAPIISKNPFNVEEQKKEEKTLGKWNAVDPIMSKEERRLLENLKGKMKSRNESTRKPTEKSRSRSRDRNYRNRRSRSRSRSRGRFQRRSRSRSRHRRSRSRSNSRGHRADRRDAPKSFGSDSKPPTTREREPARSYTATAKRDEAAIKKVMPMIGKMPVFKKLAEKKPEEEVEMEVEVEKKKEIPVKKVIESEEPKRTKEDAAWDDFMPDPMQYSAIMGAPPPPPLVEEPEVEIPPGLDPYMDSDFIPQPISDAPIPMKGPLPKDFQETLDLLYDGDKPKQIIHEVKEPIVPVVDEAPQMDYHDPSIPKMMTAEEMSQHAMMYGGFMIQNADGSNPTEHLLKSDTSDVVGSAAVASTKEANGNDIGDGDEGDSNQQADMDDLAMLGIDVNDVGSGFW